jgi:hypothetical protein
VNCLVLPSPTVAVDGVTVMLVSVCCTVTETVLVLLAPSDSVTVTRNV